MLTLLTTAVTILTMLTMLTAETQAIIQAVIIAHTAITEEGITRKGNQGNRNNLPIEKIIVANIRTNPIVSITAMATIITITAIIRMLPITITIQAMGEIIITPREKIVTRRKIITKEVHIPTRITGRQDTATIATMHKEMPPE